MAKNFQDDDREEAMIALFDLYKDETEGRSGVDAFLKKLMERLFHLN